MATNTKLKAYVRFDGSGRIVPSSLILQRFKPKDGNWQEIDAYECCNPTTTTSTTVAPTTTTTTTVVPTTTTTTAFPGYYTYNLASGGGTIPATCALLPETTPFYTSVPIALGEILYTDNTLTTVAPNGYYADALTLIGWRVNGGDGTISQTAPC